MTAARSLAAACVIGAAAIGCGAADDAPAASAVGIGGAPLYEVPEVADAERSGAHIELIEDLVLGSEDDPNQRFYQAIGATTDAEGRIYVTDWGNKRIQVFDAEGAYLATMGREGQGPGEFQGPSPAVIAGDRIFVFDGRARRTSIWSSDFTHERDVALTVPVSSLLGARADGSLIGTAHAVDPEAHGPSGEPQMRVRGIVLTPDGEEVETLFDLDANNRPTIVRGDRQTYFGQAPHPRPVYAVGPAGEVFYGNGVDYEIVALDAEGEPRWTVRVDAASRPVPESLKETLLEQVRNSYPDATMSELILPDALPAVGGLAVDAQGRLYVYPYVPRSADPSEIVDLPVDVYSRDGERIFAGTITGRRWAHSRGDHVYAAGMDRETEEFRVYRWKMETPFP